MFGTLKSILARVSTPVQRTVNLSHRPDPQTGQPEIQPVSEELVLHSKTGSVDIVKVTYEGFHHCGCTNAIPIGGRCAICGVASCAQCHGRCQVCMKPICLEHSKFLETELGARTRLCRGCYESLKRKRLVKGAVRKVLSPFIAFDNQEKP